MIFISISTNFLKQKTHQPTYLRVVRAQYHSQVLSTRLWQDEELWDKEMEKLDSEVYVVLKDAVDRKYNGTWQGLTPKQQQEKYTVPTMMRRMELSTWLVQNMQMMSLAAQQARIAQGHARQLAQIRLDMNGDWRVDHVGVRRYYDGILF